MPKRPDHRAKKKGKSEKKTPERSGSEKKQSSSRRAELMNDLERVAKGLDEEGLEFLLNQAHILLYNEQLRKAESTIKKVRVKEGPRGFEVEIVEKEGSGNFFIVVNNYRILFTLEEMRSLVKICHASADEKDASMRLYNWFNRNRKDLLIDGNVGNSSHPSLASIYRTLVSRYKVKEGR